MDDKDVIIDQLMAEIQQLRNENKALREEIARLKKNSGNSSKPPSSDIVKPPKPKGRGKNKRKRGGQKGHKKFERPDFTPEQIDQTIEYELRDKDIEGLKPLGEPEDVVPEILDETVIDESFDVTADEARHYCHRLAKAGHFVGQSSGAYLVGVERVLERYPDARVVTLLNDTGERYGGTGLWKD